jgi:hypothetical protein
MKRARTMTSTSSFSMIRKCETDWPIRFGFLPCSGNLGLQIWGKLTRVAARLGGMRWTRLVPD